MEEWVARLEPSQLQILLDSFHCLQRFKKKAITTHQMYGLAMSLLSKAMFMYDENHIQDLKEFLVSQNALSAEEANRLPWSYIKKHLPGTIPEKLTLTKRFSYSWSVICKLSTVLFSEDPFVTKELQNLYNEEIKSISRGALSDPIDRPMHSVLKGGGYLKLLRRLAGTSHLESWHAVAGSILAAKNATPALADMVLQERVGRWNIKSGIKNVGDPDFSMYRYDILDEFHMLVKDHICSLDDSTKLIQRNPIRSVDDQEFMHLVDTGQRYGLMPMMKERLGVASGGGKEDDDGDNDNDVVMLEMQEKSESIDSFERAYDVETEEETELMLSTFKELEFPNGVNGNKAVVNLSEWTDLFNKTVRQKWKDKTATKEELRLKLPHQINKAYESLGKTLLVQQLLDQHPDVRKELISCQSFLKKNPKNFKIPDFATPHTAAAAALVRGTSRKSTSAMSWNYELPKVGQGKTAVDVGGLAKKRLDIIEKVHWCPLCHLKCQEKVDGQWQLVPSVGGAVLHVDVVVDQGKRKRRGRNPYPKCNGFSRAPDETETSKETHRRLNEMKRLVRKVEKGNRGKVAKNNNKKKQKIDI